jgi:hypothetical protein
VTNSNRFWLGMVLGSALAIIVVLIVAGIGALIS